MLIPPDPSRVGARSWWLNSYEIVVALSVSDARLSKDLLKRQEQDYRLAAALSSVICSHRAEPTEPRHLLVPILGGVATDVVGVVNTLHASAGVAILASSRTVRAEHETVASVDEGCCLEVIHNPENTGYPGNVKSFPRILLGSIQQ